MTDLRARMRIFDQAPAPDYWSVIELRASAAPEATRPSRPARPMLLLVAALLVILMISAAVAVGSGVVELPWRDESPAPSVAAIPDSPEPSASMLPRLQMPGMNLDEPAGEYGWTGALGSSGWMHRVVSSTEDPSVFRETELRFAVKNECFGAGGDPVPVNVAGFDGLYVEPYEDAPGTPGRPLGATTGAYALPIGDRTLCVYLSWDPETTPEELEAARQVVESIRAQTHGPDGIRINFTLPFGWDTG